MRAVNAIERIAAPCGPARGVGAVSEAKHTQGPWQACDVGDYSDYGGRCRVILGDDLRIAVVLGDHDESAANARLIAAAPDLQLVAMLFVDLLKMDFECNQERQDHFNELRHIAEQAIDYAKGGAT